MIIYRHIPVSATACAPVATTFLNSNSNSNSHSHSHSHSHSNSNSNTRSNNSNDNVDSSDYAPVDHLR